MLTNVQESPIPQLCRKWKSDPESTRRAGCLQNDRRIERSQNLRLVGERDNKYDHATHRVRMVLFEGETDQVFMTSE